MESGLPYYVYCHKDEQHFNGSNSTNSIDQRQITSSATSHARVKVHFLNEICMPDGKLRAKCVARA